MKCFPAFEVQFHISNFECAVTGRSHLDGQGQTFYEYRAEAHRQGLIFTEPVV
jgi:hypothetical protein